ncbi:MAG TPA: hypothetical protein VGE11_11485 [Pseudonocardia sp.]
MFKVDGKALRIRKALIFEDARGTALLKIREHRVDCDCGRTAERPLWCNGRFAGFGGQADLPGGNC